MEGAAAAGSGDATGTVVPSGGPITTGAGRSACVSRGGSAAGVLDPAAGAGAGAGADGCVCGAFGVAEAGAAG